MGTLTRFLPLALSLLACWPAGAATWTQLVNLAPSGAGTMILLTDGTVMVQEADHIHWMRLTPDIHGSYVNGSWTANATSQMTTQRLYFSSNVLPNGNVFVLGGEYSGTGLPRNNSGSGEIFDSVHNTWSPIAPYPNQAGCPVIAQFGGTIAKGSAIITQIPTTATWQPGWTITGTGIPASTVILSVDSATQIHLSQNATATGNIVITLSAQSSGNTTTASKVISGIPSTAGYQLGWGVSGPGIPSGATISSVDSVNQIEISQNATATAANVTLTFSINVSTVTCYGATPSMLFPGGKVLASSLRSPNTYLYDYGSNSWSQGATKVYNDDSDEEGWALLSDGTMLTYDIFKSESAKSGYAEIYNPVTNKWSSLSPGDGTAQGLLPLLSSTGLGSELGPVLHLYDGRMLVIGANGVTSLYTPSTNSWASGPTVMGTLNGTPFQFGADDAPGAILPNGHVIFAADAAEGVSSSGTTTTGSAIITGIPSTALLQVGWEVSGTGIPSGAAIKSVDSLTQITMSVNATASGAPVTLQFGVLFSLPTQLFDFDPVANLISPVSPALPDKTLNTIPSYVTRMLMLPTGQLLFSDASTQLWIYTPDGAPNPSLQPAFSKVAAGGGGLFTLSGTQLSGQSAGSSYGDDVETDENYPIIGFTKAGNVYYARTTNWSYIGVAGGALPQTVDFTLNPAMPAGAYSMIVSAAGISSNPVPITFGADLESIVSAPAVPATSAVQDAESSRTAIVSGQWTAIYGQGLSNTTRIWNNSDFTGGTAPGSPLPTTLDGVSATIGGQPAAVYYISPTQIDVLSPSNLPLGNAGVVVNNNGLLSASLSTSVVQSSPSFFYYNAGGNVFPAAVHLSGTLVGDPVVSGSSVERAHPGEVLLMYANGLAPSPGGAVVAPATFSSPVTITAGSFSVTVLGAALVSSGQFQINVQLPANIPAGYYALTMTVPNGSTSTAGITVMLPVGP